MQRQKCVSTLRRAVTASGQSKQARQRRVSMVQANSHACWSAASSTVTEADARDTHHRQQHSYTILYTHLATRTHIHTHTDGHQTLKEMSVACQENILSDGLQTPKLT